MHIRISSGALKTAMDVQRQLEFLVQSQAKHDAQIGQLIDLHKEKEMVEGINRLVRVVELHEHRLEGLEGQAS